jgi:hypothetical protein
MSPLARRRDETWTADRVRWVGVAALGIGVVFAALITWLAILGIGDVSALHIALAAGIGLAHIMAYLSMLGALVAAHAVGKVPEGRFVGVV